MAKDDAALRAVEQPEDDIEVDIDLDELQEQLKKEATGDPTTVRIDGKVIHVQFAGDWNATAYRAMMEGRFDDWADEVISDEKEREAWEDADLTLREMEAVVLQCAKKSRLGMGKSRRQSGSSRRSRRK